MIYAALFGAATAVGALISIPLPPVPITLQTFFMSLAGALLRARLAALSQVVYILLGIIGLPVFALGKAGLGVLFGPTGGYLVGFIGGAFTIGKLVRYGDKPGFGRLLAAMGAGTLVVYIFGIAQLILVADLSLTKALSVGALPFLFGDALKITAAAGTARALKQRINPLGE
jgi:biotin transport system substrate-specific component